MKKARVIIILVLGLALLSACAQTQETMVQPTATSVLSRILQRGELIVGTAGSMPPFNMTTKEGKVIGFEIDLARYFAATMGVELKLEVMPFSELLPALEKGKIDMILSGMTITSQRNLKVAFVGPYFISGKAFLTKIETIASPKDYSEIDSPNTTLAALKGSTSQLFVESVMPNAKLVTTKHYDEAVDMVIQGKVDALVADYPVCVVSVLRYPNEGLVSVITPLTHEPLGIAVPPGDSHLINWLENSLRAYEGTGGLKEADKRWFESSSWLRELP
jgi:polar amino acid transport system substrate-binding protein